MTDPGSSPALVPAPVPASAPAAGVRQRVIVAAVAAVTLAADQGAKLWALSALPGRGPVPVLGDVISLRLLRNSGAAFSIGSDVTWILTILAAGAVVGIAWFAGRVRSSGWAVALGLMLGGAATHLLDRLFRSPGFGVGHVVDFIDYNGWFVGNVADIALTFGAGLAVVLSALGIGMDGQRRSWRPERGTPAP